MRIHILPFGRFLRFFFGTALLLVALPFLLQASPAFLIRTLSLFLGLVAFYSAIHFLVAKYFPELNTWLGAAFANFPIIIVYLLGISGGPLFGAGEGQLGVFLYLGLALMLAGLRADPGCEVMSIPGMIFGNRTHLACIAFSPIDWLEAKLTHRPENKS